MQFSDGLRFLTAYLLLSAGPDAVLASGQADSKAPPVRRPVLLDDYYAIKEIDGVELSPDGRVAVYVVRAIDREHDTWTSTLWRVPVSGGAPQPLTHGNRSDSMPRFAPDGRYLAFLSEVDDQSQVYVLPMTGGEAFKVTGLPGGVAEFDWSPDSLRLVVVSGGPMGDDRDSDNKPIVVTRLQHKEDGIGYLTREKNHLFLADMVDVLASSGERQARATQLTDGPYDESVPAWSPDGRSIAFASNRSSEPDDNYNLDIWTIELASGNVTRLTSDAGEDTQPVWAPDGRHIAYMNTPVDPPIYSTLRAMLVDARGGVPVDLTGRFDRQVNDGPRWAPDGRSVYVPIIEGGRVPLARVTLDGRRTTVLDGEVGEFAVGPDFVVGAMDTPAGATDVYAAPADGSGPPVGIGHVNDTLFQTVEVSVPEAVHFKSADGTPIEAFVIKPPHFDESRKYPLIMRLHGGPVDHHTDSFWFEAQYLASIGYVVVLPNPRGSNGYGEAFSNAIAADWGNKDYDDVMAAVDFVIGQGYVDPGRMGVGGWSYGGLLTNYVIAKTNRFLAAVSGASESDMFGAFGTDDLRKEWLSELGPPWDHVELYRRLSPIMNVRKMVTPTLVMCGEDDLRCPLPQSEQLYLALRTIGTPTALIIYPGQSHDMLTPAFMVDRVQRTGLWYDKYVQGKDVDPTFEKADKTGGKQH